MEKSMWPRFVATNSWITNPLLCWWEILVCLIALCLVKPEANWEEGEAFLREVRQHWPGLLQELEGAEEVLQVLAEDEVVHQCQWAVRGCPPLETRYRLQTQPLWKKACLSLQNRKIMLSRTKPWSIRNNNPSQNKKKDLIGPGTTRWSSLRVLLKSTKKLKIRKGAAKNTIPTLKSSHSSG